MNDNHREIASVLLTLTIIGLAFFVIHPFIPSFFWAAIIAGSTYPLYKPWERWFGRYSACSAFMFTLMVALVIILPLSFLISLLVQETQVFITYLLKLNQEGERVPLWFQSLPWFQEELTAYWQATLGEPGSLTHALSAWHISLTPASYYIKQVGTSLMHRSLQLGFTLMTLFFFYRDGRLLVHQIDRVGAYCLHERWDRFSKQLPEALRAIVNGTIMVGMGVGILMGIGYSLVGLQAPVLLGFITAVAAMVPFAAPLVFGVVGLLLLADGLIVHALIILGMGTVVLFLADHFIRPALIGSATKLPFLAVLFGILGGIQSFGLLGLFLGPIVMVLFMTLWYEPERLEP